MQIRKAITTDIKHIIETVQASYKFSYRGYLPDEYLDDLSVTEDILEKWHNYIQKYECYVAEKQNQIVAFTMLDSNEEAKIFEICILYVRPEYQKQGIGSLLVNFVCNMKKQQTYKKSKLWTMKNGPSIKFYEKKGFIATSEEKPWKFDIPIVKMIKNLMNYKFGVYGDSIAFGYGNNNQSWFDELYLGNEALKLAQNGEQIEGVLRKIKQDNNHYDTLFLAVGINDLLSGAPKPNQIDISSLINQYEEVLKVAKTKASNIIVQSVLPVREELFPNQDWLDEDKWGFNADVETFNQKLAELCETHQIKYLDAYMSFCSLDLSKIYMDAVHLNKEGQSELAKVYRKHSSKIKYVIFDVGGVCYPYTLDNLNQYFRNKVADKNAFDSKKGIKSFDYNPFMQGTINYTQFCKDLCNYCGVNHSPDMEAEINIAMHEGVGTIFEETLTIMNKLKKQNIEICLLSNALPNLIDTANFLTKSENIFVSYELRLLKPNPEIYKKVLQKLNATPEEVIFIDDKSRNVEAAKSLGIHGIVFDQKTIIEDVNKLVSIS